MSPTAFHHVVLVRLRSGVTLERVRAAREAMAELVETLPGLLHLGVVDNLSALNAGYTIALCAVFENRHAFEVCTRHPEWLRVWNQLLAPIIADRIVAEGEG